MKVPFAETKKTPEEVAYEKMVDENEKNEHEQQEQKGLVATIANKKVESCCLNPKNCCFVKNPISQKVIDVVKSRLN